MIKWIPALLALCGSTTLFLREQTASHLLIPFLALLFLLCCASMWLSSGRRADWIRLSMSYVSSFFIVWMMSEVTRPSTPIGTIYAISALSVLALLQAFLSFSLRARLFLVGALSMGLLIAFFSGGKGGSDPMVDFFRHRFSLSLEQAEIAVKIVRKAIHFLFYGLLGFFAGNGAYRSDAERKSAFSFGVSVALAHAVFDESRQHYTPGRTGAFSDVLLDLSGGIAFLAPMALIKEKNLAKS